MAGATYRSIFSPSTTVERAANFETYFIFSRALSGVLEEADQNLSRKREALKAFQTNAVRSRKALPDPALFYRNYVDLVDDPSTFDRKTLLLTCIYKFARHEWVGISGAWAATPDFANSKTLTDKISRYHLAEEFCHVRFFHEMFRCMQLENVEWRPLGPVMQRVYQIFPYLPGWLLDAPAFVTELMGIVFYVHVDAVLDDVFADEPEVRDRIRALLHEIMVDEVAHAGQRRNFIGPLGMRFARLLVGPLFRAFFKDIPESKLLFDVDRMIADAHAFDYSLVPADMVAKSWVPSYCTAP